MDLLPPYSTSPAVCGEPAVGGEPVVAGQPAGDAPAVGGAPVVASQPAGDAPAVGATSWSCADEASTSSPSSQLANRFAVAEDDKANGKGKGNLRTPKAKGKGKADERAKGKGQPEDFEAWCEEKDKGSFRDRYYAEFMREAYARHQAEKGKGKASRRPWSCDQCVDEPLYAMRNGQHMGPCQQCRQVPLGPLVGTCQKCKESFCFLCLQLPYGPVALCERMPLVFLTTNMAPSAFADPPQDLAFFSASSCLRGTRFARAVGD